MVNKFMQPIVQDYHAS